MLIRILLVSFVVIHVSDSRGNIAETVRKVYWKSKTKFDYEAERKAMDIREYNFPKQNYSDVDLYSYGSVESAETILLIGKRMFRENVTKFCSGLIDKQISEISEDFRDAINFKPVSTIPSPVMNLTVSIPTRWFRVGSFHRPSFFICYEGESSIKIIRINSSLEKIERNEIFHHFQLNHTFDDNSHLREVMILLDGRWNNNYLLPRNMNAVTIVATENNIPRDVFTEQCDKDLGRDQECCLWKSYFLLNEKSYEYFSCQGRIPNDSNIPPFMPRRYQMLWKYGQMSRRFIKPPIKFCHGLEYRRMLIERKEGEFDTIEGLNATKCGVFY